jgi:hypothetical protein
MALRNDVYMRNQCKAWGKRKKTYVGQPNGFHPTAQGALQRSGVLCTFSPRWETAGKTGAEGAGWATRGRVS